MGLNTFESLSLVLANALSTLEMFVEDAKLAQAFLRRLGWDLPPGVEDIGLAALDLTTLVETLSQIELSLTLDPGGGTLEGAAVVADLLKAIEQLIQDIQKLITSLDSLPSDYLNKTQIATQFFRRLFDLLLVDQCQQRFPLLGAILHLLGLFSLEYHDADSTIYQVQHVRRVVHFERLSEFFGSLSQTGKDVYGWGTPNADITALLINLGQLLLALGANGQMSSLTRRAEERLMGQPMPQADTNPSPQLFVDLFQSLDVGGLKVGVTFFELRATTQGGSDSGLGASPYAHGSVDLNFPITDALSLELEATLDLQIGVALLLRPGQPVTVKGNLVSGQNVQGMASGKVGLQLVFARADGTPVHILSLDGSSGISAKQFYLGAGASSDATGAVAAYLKAGIKGGHAGLGGSDDGFLSKILPSNGIDADFDFGVGWSPLQGFFFEGTSSLALVFALHQSIGPFTLDTIHLGLGVKSGEFPMEVSLTGSAVLGPLGISVDRLGLIADLKLQQGNLGPVDFGLNFKFPTGLGIVVDAGVVTGGGYILFDADKGEYAGILELSLEFVQVKVIALLDTHMPDGSKGYSFLFIITTDFIPIQLGFGFTLNGVGGLAGINRTMLLDVLRNGLKNHILNSILFPSDPIQHATQIISDVSSVFPPANARYVFGPMLELGWGTPTLLTAQLGMILEIPDPVRLAIIGKIELVLPTEDEALIDIQMDVIGTIDFGAKKLSIDATLFDSRILMFAISGDMAMRLNWGANASFVVAIGGLHPKFPPPPDLPKLNRLAVGLRFSDAIHLSMTSYQAVTSNSVQFGSGIELLASVAGASLHGYLNFDALFILSPFSFVVELQAGLDISYEGVSLLGVHIDATFSGPNPWHIDGSASFNILFFSISVHVQASFGDTQQATLRGQPVLPALTGALQDPRNWQAALPENSARAVSLASTQLDPKTILVHPMGALAVRETAVPLELPIDKFGSAQPTDGRKFSITGVTLNGQAQPVQVVQDSFAPAQFKNMSDADKLAAPSYELFDAGVAISSATVTSGRPSRDEVHYETVVIDDPLQPVRPAGIYRLPAYLQDAFIGQGASALAAVRRTGLGKFLEPGQAQTIAISPTRYVVASTEDLTRRTDLVAGKGVSYAQAAAILQDHLAAHPEETPLLQVLPIHEAVTP